MLKRKTGRAVGWAFNTALVLMATGLGAQSWQSVDPGTQEDLTSVAQSFGSDCWITGTGGFTASGTGCTTFTPFDIGIGAADLTSQTRQTTVDVWIGGEDGQVRRQTAFDVWANRDIPGGAGESFVLFSRSSGASWAVGEAGRIFKNDLGGADDWSLSYHAQIPLYGGSGFIGSLAYVVGAGGLILGTTNGGDSWTQLASGTTSDLHDYIEGPLGPLVAGADGTILLSTDSGSTWTPQVTGTTATLRALSTSGQNANWILAVGDGGVTLRSTDGGVTWCYLHTTWRDLMGVWFATNSTATIVGVQGTALRTTNGGGDCQPAPLMLLFGDGFESGDAQAWSATTP